MNCCIPTTYFQLYSGIYWQKEGLGMGSPSLIMASICMQCVNEMDIEVLPLNPIMCYNYIDDNLILLPTLGRCANTANTCELKKTFWYNLQ